ncbi:MAG: AEC family transporter, partial [Planctomycetota bacterium]
MWSVVASVIPLVLAIAIGVLLRRIGLLDADSARRLNKLVYWVLFPCFLVVKLGTSEALAHPGGVYPLGPLLSQWIAIAITMLVFVGFGRRLDPGVRGSVFSVAFRSNGAFIGLPLAALLGSNGAIGDDAVARYLLLLTGIVPTFNVVSVIGFILPRHGLRWAALLPTLRGLLTNPILWGCFIGLGLGLLPEDLAQLWRGGVIEDSLWLVGDPAIGLALIGAGASLRLTDFRSAGTVTWLATAWKLAVMPALALGAGLLLGLSHADLVVLTIVAVCPTAVATVPMATALEGDLGVAATGVVLTTLLAPVSIVCWLALWLA